MKYILDDIWKLPLSSTDPVMKRFERLYSKIPFDKTAASFFVS